MSTLHPALRKHILNPLFWWAVFKARHKWLDCHSCGFLNECLPYGQSVLDNFRALEADGLGPQPKSVRGPADKVVCIHCCMEMREHYGDMPVLPHMAEA